MNLRFVTSNQISTYRKLNLLLIISSFLLTLEMQEDSNRPKYTYYTCFTQSEKKRPLKTAANCFDECFFIPCNNWKTLFFINVLRCSEVLLIVMLLLSLKKVF